MTDQKLVLIVEDEEPARRLFATALEQNGYLVLQAGSAEEALVVAEGAEQAIDALLMDIMLPDSWGTRLAQSLRVLHPDMGVIYASGYAQDDPIMMSGIDKETRFLHKPFEIADLLNEMSSMLESGSAQAGD
ncbi:MAG: response regulator [Longimicrobiales bacterium]